MFEFGDCQFFVSFHDSGPGLGWNGLKTQISGFATPARKLFATWTLTFCNIRVIFGLRLFQHLRRGIPLK